jgi:hypothetical protein
MTNEHLKIASKLINEVINNTNDTFAERPEYQDYLLRRLNDGTDNIVVQPTYSKVFYSHDNIIHIVEALKLHYFYEVRENLAGVMTPTIFIF